MPEPDINDPDFNRSTTDRKKFQRRSKARKKLPLEFAAFRLNDGRALGQVVGPDFFGPPSGSDGGAALPRGVRDRLAENKSSPADTLRDDSRIAPRPKPADEGGILDPLSGPDEREPAGAAVNSSVAGRLPAGIAGGMPGPDRGAPDVDPRVIAGMDDAGLTGLADSRLDFDELTALKPKTYGDSMRYAAAIAKVAGMRKEEVDGLGSLLARDENGMPRDVSGADILPSRARENYERFVTAARARRNIPIDIPLTADGKIDYSLVQPGFLYRGGRGVVLNVGPDRKSFVEAPRRPEKVEAAPTKPENGARPAAAKVDPRSIADMDGPWPDVDPRSIAGMDDAGLDVPATRIGKARDTVAALEGVTLPSAVDQVRRDTLKAMVGIHAGEKLPRDYARKARNKAMLDFMAAPPALRESKLADQVGLLMDGISDNGKRAVGAYTALKGKMKGIEAMNLPRLYDLKRELEGDVNMGERQRRNFAILIDNEIENSTYRGDTPRAEDGPEVVGTIYSGLASRAPETYRLPPSAIPNRLVQREFEHLHTMIAGKRTQINEAVTRSFLMEKELRDNGASQEEIDRRLHGFNSAIDENLKELAENRARLAEVIATVPLSALKEAKESNPARDQRQPGSPAPKIEGNAAEIEADVRGLLKQKLKETPGDFVSFVMKNESFRVPGDLTQRQIGMLAKEISIDASELNGMQQQRKYLLTRFGENPSKMAKQYIAAFDTDMQAVQSLLDGRVDEIASLVARYTSTEYETRLEAVARDKAERPLFRDAGDSWMRGAGAGDVASGAHAMEAASGDMERLDEMLEQRKGQDSPVVDMLVVESEIAAENWLNAVGGIASGLQDQAEHPAGPALAAFRKAAREGDGRGMADNFLLDPTMLSDMFVEGVATNPFTFGVGMAGSIIAAMFCPPSLAINIAVAAGGSALDTAAAAYQDYGAAIVAAMEKRFKVDFNDTDKVKEIWNNKENRKIIQDIASNEWKKSALKNFVIGFAINAGVNQVAPGGASKSKAVQAGGAAVVHTGATALNAAEKEFDNR